MMTFKNSLLPFVKKLEEIFEEPFTEDTRLGMLIHMGCLIDRLTKSKHLRSILIWIV